VSKIFSTFVEQPGVPLVSVQAKCEDDKTRIELEQRRFFGSRRMREQESKELWEIPVCFRTSEVAAGGCRMVTEHKQEIVLPGCHPWIFANGGARGYYVSEYDAAAASGIVANTGSLSEAERLVLLNNTWALVAAGEREADGYLDLTESLQSDDHAEIWRDIGEKLGWLRDRVLQGDAVQKNYEEWVRKLLLPTAERLGWSERPGDTEQVRQLRAAVLSILGNVGQDNAALKQAAELAKKYLDNPASVDPALAGTVLNLTARQGDSALYEQILARVKEPRRPDEHYRLLAALGNFRDPQLLGRTLELTLTDTVRGQDVMRAISGVLYNPAGRELAWDFLRSRWPQLQKKVPESNLTYFAEMGTAFCDADHRQQFKDFFTETRMPGVQRKVRQSLESIDGCVEMRRSQLPQVQTWLRRHEAAAAGGGAH
jgi:aminopeptidase N